MGGFYLGHVEAVVRRAHPAIRTVSVSQAPGPRDALTVAVTAPGAPADEVRAALGRSEPSFRPRGFTIEYRVEDGHGRG